MERYIETERGMEEYLHGKWVHYDEAQAEIARLQAEVARLVALNEELDGANIVNRNAIRILKAKLSTARHDALEDSAQIADEYEQQDLASAIRALRKETP